MLLGVSHTTVVSFPSSLVSVMFAAYTPDCVHRSHRPTASQLLSGSESKRAVLPGDNILTFGSLHITVLATAVQRLVTCGDGMLLACVV